MKMEGELLKPLVSVIVPVYKVEDCLARCLDSLCRQSLIDIEILLIDDASPDFCGDICERYAERDARFRIFHNKTNQGLSVARNIGIKNAFSDFLMFVDSDDYVHKDYCKAPYEIAVKYKADLVMFRSQYIKKIESCSVKDRRANFYMSSGCKTRLEAMTLLEKSVGQAAWNKLYRKELFKNIVYPPGYLFEDLGTTYKTVWQASSIYFLDVILYYKCYRTGSITTLKTEKSLHDWIEMYMQQYHDLAKWGYPKDRLETLLINIAIEYCMKKKPDMSEDFYRFSTKILNSNKSIPVFLTWKRKIMFVLFNYYRPLFELICTLYGKKVC